MFFPTLFLSCLCCFGSSSLFALVGVRSSSGSTNERITGECRGRRRWGGELMEGKGG